MAACVRLAKNASDVNDITHDCWLVDTGLLDHDTYPRFKVTDLGLPEVKHESQGKRVGASGRGSHTVKCFKFVVALFNPELLLLFQEKSHANQTSHRCGHYPIQRCVSPYHLIAVLSDKNNKDMHKCVRGNALTCPGHGPAHLKCIYTSATGVYLKCRNGLTTTEEHVCSHVPNCFTAPRDDQPAN